MSTKLRVDDELRSFIPPLAEAEYAALERSIVETGRAIDAITTWRGTILDGHNRYAICSKHGLPYDTIEIELADRDAAKRWMYDHQVARRNLSRDQMIALAALRGVPVPAQLVTPVANEAVQMAKDDRGRALLERVLAGRMSAVAARNEYSRKAREAPARSRRTALEIANDAFAALSTADKRAHARVVADALRGVQ